MRERHSWFNSVFVCHWKRDLDAKRFLVVANILGCVSSVFLLRIAVQIIIHSWVSTKGREHITYYCCHYNLNIIANKRRRLILLLLSILDFVLFKAVVVDESLHWRIISSLVRKMLVVCLCYESWWMIACCCFRFLSMIKHAMMKMMSTKAWTLKRGQWRSRQRIQEHWESRLKSQSNYIHRLDSKSCTHGQVYLCRSDLSIECLGHWKHQSHLDIQGNILSWQRFLL